MIYRKTPTHRPKLLLRISVPVGAAALALATIDCSAGSLGSTVACTEACCEEPCGVVAHPSDASSDATNSDVFVGGGVTGVLPYYPDAGDSSTMVTGVVVHPEDAGDASEDSMINGVIAHLDAGDQ
jgi:hypothetical protein